MTTEFTPRQLAGKANRAKRIGITDEGRKALREAALKNKPWERATGPRTPEGKQQSRLNSLKHGGRACGIIPDAVKAFIADLKSAELARGPLPATILPLRAYLYSVDAYEHPLLVARLKALRSRYGDLCIREHLRSPNFRLYVSRMGLSLDCADQL